MTMVQITDVSSQILYDQEKAQNKLLSMINACVSHELRNPLNALLASNEQKRMLFKALEEAHKLMEAEQRKVAEEIMRKLWDALEIQDSSGKLMKFMVQDLLDYS